MPSTPLLPDQPTVGEGKQRNRNHRRVLRDIGNIEVGENNKCKKAAAGEKDADAALRLKNEEKSVNKATKTLPSLLTAPTKEKQEKSVNKGSKTLTSTLIARSKAAANIDAADLDDELAAVEYVEDMYNFYKQTEKDGKIVDYMASQPGITSNMRAILVEWLIQVHNKLHLMPETLYLTINILDRFLALQTVSTAELQLVGISSLLIASKYEEIWAPEVSELMKISSHSARERVLVMEKAILGKLDWYLTVPTPYVFLTRYIKAASAAADKEMENMAFFYAEAGLMSYSTVLRYSPSELSAAAVYAARFTLNKIPFWTQTLQHYTAYSEDRLLECAKTLIGFATEKQHLKASYSDPEQLAVFSTSALGSSFSAS